jgi:hypothetical protein
MPSPQQSTEHLLCDCGVYSTEKEWTRADAKGVDRADAKGVDRAEVKGVDRADAKGVDRTIATRK